MARKKTDAKTEDTPTAAPQQAVATAPEPSANGEKARPVKTFSCPVNGASIEAAVWPKEIATDGHVVTVYSVTVQKNYYADGWKHTGFLRGSEIHVARHVLSLAETWILDARTTDEPPF